MPKIEVEILRTVTVTREEKTTVELDVPQSVIDDGEEVDWIDTIMDKDDDGTLTQEDRDVYEAINGAEWDVSDEGETVQYDEAYSLTG